MNAKRIEKDFEELFRGDRYWIDRLNGSKILITGATGLIGSIIAKAILYYNTHFNGTISLICSIRDIEKAKRVYEDYAKNKYLEFCVCDINTGISYDDKVDFIIHCANTTSSLAYVNQPVETIKTIVIGTDNMLQFALKKNVKAFLYMSSMEIYGVPSISDRKIEETDSGCINTLSVRSSYSEGKRLAECLCASYASEYGLKTVIARSAQVFGAGVSLNDNRVFMQLCKSAMNSENFIMRSDGSSYGNYCYTTDAAKAIMILLSQGEVGQAYNIVNEDNTMTIKEMAEMVAHEIADDSFKIVYDIPDSELTYGYAPKVKLLLSGKKMNSLGWYATVPLKEMYSRMIESLQQ